MVSHILNFILRRRNTETVLQSFLKAQKDLQKVHARENTKCQKLSAAAAAAEAERNRAGRVMGKLRDLIE